MKNLKMLLSGKPSSPLLLDHPPLSLLMASLLGLSSRPSNFMAMAQMYLKEHFTLPPQVYVLEIPSPSPINVVGSVGDLDIVLRSIEIRRRRSLRGPVGVRMRREVVEVRRSARSVSRVNPVILLMNLTVSPIVHNLQVSHFSLPNLSGVLKDPMFSKHCVDFFTHIHSFYYSEYVNSSLEWGCYE
jgi:hypothetical protein